MLDGVTAKRELLLSTFSKLTRGSICSAISAAWDCFIGAELKPQYHGKARDFLYAAARLVSYCSMPDRT